MSATLVQVQRRAEEVRFPGAEIAAVEKILVARRDRLGDFVLTLPAIAAIQATYPSARIGLLVGPGVASMARRIRGVDQVLCPVDRIADLVSAIEKFRPELLVCISRDGKVARAAHRARVRVRVGPGNRFYSPLFHRRVSERRRHGGLHEVEYALSFAHLIGAPGAPESFPIELPVSSLAEADDWLMSARVVDRFVVLHPGSGGSCPRWPSSHFAELARRLVASGVATVVSIGPGDQDVADRVWDGCSRFEGDLDRMAAVLKRADLVVSNSTGPIHLAAALGAPTLAIHAPWPSCGPGRWGPYAANGQALIAGGGRADRWTRRQRRTGAAALMASLEPEVVHREVVALLDLPER